MSGAEFFGVPAMLAIVARLRRGAHSENLEKTYRTAASLFVPRRDGGDVYEMHVALLKRGARHLRPPIF